MGPADYERRSMQGSRQEQELLNLGQNSLGLQAGAANWQSSATLAQLADGGPGLDGSEARLETRFGLHMSHSVPVAAAVPAAAVAT